MPIVCARLPRLAAAAVLAVATVVPIAAAAERIQGSGVARTETRAVAGFHRIALGVAADVELRQEAAEALTITGDDNVVANVETVVEDGTLRIRWKHRDTQATYKQLHVIVAARAVDEITIGGAGRVHAGRLQAPAFKATLGGSGKIAIDALDAKTVGLTLAGTGESRLAGRTDALDATLAGSGELAAGKLAARTARLTLQGSGRAVVRAAEKLDVTMAGSGDVVYFGNPAVRSTIMGSGTVTAGKE